MKRLLRWLFALFLADIQADDERRRRLGEARYRRFLESLREGDTPESIEARRQALLRLYRVLHRL